MASEKKDQKKDDVNFPAIRAEIAAISEAYEALKDLDTAAQRRAMEWLESRLRDDQVRRDRAARPTRDDEPPF